jgi:hypothetical protein
MYMVQRDNSVRKRAHQYACQSQTHVLQSQMHACQPPKPQLLCCMHKRSSMHLSWLQSPPAKTAALQHSPHARAAHQSPLPQPHHRSMVPMPGGPLKTPPCKQRTRGSTFRMLGQTHGASVYATARHCTPLHTGSRCLVRKAGWKRLVRNTRCDTTRAEGCVQKAGALYRGLGAEGWGVVQSMAACFQKGESMPQQQAALQPPNSRMLAHH